ncbi:MAG: hypothetical protein H6737_17085 [Alphaproteobacteria bacterium]|nr:hypothetical protein [Alphaproteobacteria bacterium]
MRVAPLAALVVLGCQGLPPCEGDEFIAFQADFERYESWRRFEIDPPDPRLGEGRRVVYINAVPPKGSTSFPQCTMIVKQGQSGDDPTAWLMVGMAKRGGTYNADGAAGWEWFDLDLSEDGVPLIDWRGPTPPEGRGYECALGEDEPGAEGVGDCNTCHAAGVANDFVLSGPLRLQ